MSAAASLVRGLPRATLIVGKGGVGKTTAAAALALESSRSMGRTLVLTTDPARALPAVLATPVRTSASPVSYAPSLDARVLDATTLRDAFMERWGPALTTILDRGTYLDTEDIGPLVDTALPGSDEIFAALELAALVGAAPSDDGYARVVVDTAPTGHTLRLLELPRTFRALVRLLDTMQGKHRLMVRALTRGYRQDDADAFLHEMTALVDALENALADPERCAAVMITAPGQLVQEETRRYLDALRALRVTVDAVIWNAADAADAVGAHVGESPSYVVPPLDPAPVGEEGLDRWLRALRDTTAQRRAAKKSARTNVRRSRDRPGAASVLHGQLDAVLRPLTIVAGKGGVGKTTTAAALALHSARGARTLVVSTDPAPSLSDALGLPIGDEDTPVGGLLFARQMDASAAFARIRDRYQARVDALFDGLVGRGMDLSHDRAIVRDLLALAPPGIDEVYALSLLADALFEREYARVVVDPAPTGHLLRLLEMPATALAWSHQLMRLMLKYKEIGGLGDAAADVLAFARDLRALDATLRDANQAAVVLVTLDQAVVAGETERLAREVLARGIAISGVILNRASGTATFPLPAAPAHLRAPLAVPAPVGAQQLADWSHSWQPLTS